MFDWLIDWLNLTAGQPIQDYFMPRGYRTAFIVSAYLHFLSSCF